MVNYFNFREGDEVEAKIFVAREQVKNFNKNYMVDINNIIASANINISKKQNVLGLIVSMDNEIRFYFANVSIGRSITASAVDNELAAHARKYLVNKLINSLSFRQCFSGAGAIIVDKKLDEQHVDLSSETLNKTTIIDLVKSTSCL